MLKNSIESIDTWMQASTTNYGLYFVIMALILILSFTAWWFIDRKIGKSDERSDYIKLRIGYITLGIGWVLTLAFMSSLIDASVEYPSQLGIIPLAMTAVAGCVVTAVYYNKSK